MAVEAPMAAGAGSPEADGGRGKIRAADADRDRMAEILGTAYTEGRLTKEEYDARLEAAYSARTYADLDQLVADLPVQAPVACPRTGSAVVPAADRTNGLAVASFVCGLGQVFVGPLAIPAIVLGHMAWRQIRRTGEQGAGLALAGLVLGWTAVIMGLVFFIATNMAMAGTIQVP